MYIRRVLAEIMPNRMNEFKPPYTDWVMKHVNSLLFLHTTDGSPLISRVVVRNNKAMNVFVTDIIFETEPSYNLYVEQFQQMMRQKVLEVYPILKTDNKLITYKYAISHRDKKSDFDDLLPSECVEEFVDRENTCTSTIRPKL